MPAVLFHAGRSAPLPGMGLRSHAAVHRRAGAAGRSLRAAQPRRARCLVCGVLAGLVWAWAPGAFLQLLMWAHLRMPPHALPPPRACVVSAMACWARAEAVGYVTLGAQQRVVMHDSKVS